MVFVTLAQEDEIVIIDAEDEDTEDFENIIKDCDANGKVVEQYEKSPNGLFLKTQLLKTNFLHILKKCTICPVLIYSYYVEWKLQVDNNYLVLY